MRAIYHTKPGTCRERDNPIIAEGKSAKDHNDFNDLVVHKLAQARRKKVGTTSIVFVQW